MASRTRRPAAAVEPEVPSLDERVTVLEEKMEKVLATPAIKKRTPDGVCVLGVEPSENCKDATLGKFQSGCHGTACKLRNAEYFREWRERKKAQAAASATKTPAARASVKPKPVKVNAPSPPRRGVKRKAVPAPAQPAKRPIKRRGA